MGIVLKYLAPEFDAWVKMTTFEAACYLALFVGIGSVIYAGTCLLLGIKPSSIKM